MDVDKWYYFLSKKKEPFLDGSSELMWI